MKCIKTIISIFISFVIASNVNAQAFQTFEKRRLQEANEAFDNQQYLVALDLYKKSLNVKESREAVQGLAMTNFYLKNYEEASAGFLYLKENFELFQSDILPYFETCIKLKDFKQAQLLYQLSKFSNRIKISQKDLEYMHEILENNANPEIDEKVASVSKLTGINSNYRDFGLQQYNGSYYFVSNRPDKFFKSSGNTYENLVYKAYQINSLETESKQNAQLVTFVENKAQHGVITFSDQFVFYSASELENSKKLKNLISLENDILYPEVFFRQILENGEFGPEFSLIHKKSGKYAMIDPHWDSERHVLIFSSDMPGGYGGLDLYYVDYLGNQKWSKPKNLGNKINSDKDERSPFVNDGKLYFSSNGQGGYGGYDIYFTKIDSHTYGKPENLLTPVNSHGDDLFFTIFQNQDKKEAFLSSNRGGNDDLYKVSYQYDNMKMLKGNVFDLDYNTPFKSTEIIFLQDLDTTLIYTDDYGRFEITWNPELDKSSVLILQKGYEPLEYIISSSTNIEGNIKLGLTKVKTERQLLFRGGFDESGKLTSGNNIEILDKLALLLKFNVDMEVQIISHTDARGNPISNKRKSEKRALELKNYLVSQNIDKNRIKTLGEGSNKPINDCIPGLPCSDEELLENDRVEFEIIYKKK